MTGLDAAKRRARSVLRARLAGFGTVRETVSAELVSAFIGSALWAESARVMAYLASDREVDLDALWTVTPRPMLLAPRVDWGSGAMSPRVIERLESGVEIRRHGIREPVEDAPECDPARIATVLVPGLAFDAGGGRLGRGGGFYDRFLPRTAGATLVGVCWSGQITDRVPAGPDDVGVHMLLTEHGLREVGRGPG